RQFEGDSTKGLTNFILGPPRVFYVHLKPPNRLLFENTGFDFFNSHGIPLRPEIQTNPSFEDRLSELADAIEKTLLSLKGPTLTFTKEIGDIFRSSTVNSDAPLARKNRRTRQSSALSISALSISALFIHS